MSSFRYFGARLRALRLVAVAIAAIACGGDSGTGPTPPAGSQQVPRVFALSRVNGSAPPAQIFVMGGIDMMADSGSATLQGDSMLVVRIVSTVAGTATPFTAAGLLDASGRATFHYVSGTSDSAQINRDGTVTAWLTVSYPGMASRTSTLVFSGAYHGPALNPIPRIDAIAPATAPEYGPDTTLVLDGSSFMPGTLVQWGSTYLSVTYESEHRITAKIPAYLLTTAGPVQITVSNPAPGGGNRIFEYDVVLPAPVLTSIQPAVVPAGGGDFTLHVHGSFFPYGATVLWNGTARQTFWRGAQDVLIDVSAADIQTAGTVQISVQTGPPGGGRSAAVPLSITGTPARKLGEITTRFDAATLVADPVRPLVYAGAGLGESNYGPTSHPHSVVAIDPVAGSIVWAISLPKEVGSLAISDDGQFLYVGESGAPTIVRVALATHTIDMTITLPNPATQPSGIAVSPGNPHTFAVVRACSNCSPVIGGLAIYDDSVPRPGTASSGPSVLAFLNPTELYGVNYLSDISTYAVSPTGVSEGTRTSTAVAGPYTLSSGHIYAANGGVYDIASNTSKTFPIAGLVIAVVPSSDGTRLYGVDANTGFLRSIDPVSGAELGAVPVTAGANASGQIVRWGADGVVYTGVGAIVYVRADFIH